MTRNISISTVALWVSSLTLLFFSFRNPNPQPISWDVLGYYLYLPLITTYGELDDNVHKVLKEKVVDEYNLSSTLYQVHKTSSGKYIIQYPSGLSYFYVPFYFVAHLIAPSLGYPADGFSAPYQWALHLGGILFTLVSLVLLRRLLKEFFNDGVVAIVLFILVFSTNAFVLFTSNIGMPHHILFGLYTVLIGVTHRWHIRQTVAHSVILGLTCGIIILSRPTDIVCLFIPLLWGVGSKESLIEKLKMLQIKRYYVLLAALFAILPAIPQLIYWKINTGEWLYYSYMNPAEGLDVFTPHTWKFLFSFRKGWLIYTPVMIFAIAGIVWSYQKQRSWFWMLAAFFVFNLWLVSSWTCWWYANSFGSRAMVQSYALMALPLGVFIREIKQVKPVYFISIFLLICFFLLLNIFQTWQFFQGILPPDRITRAYYVKVFGKTSYDGEYDDLLLIDRTRYHEVMPDGMNYVDELLYHQTYDTVQSNIYPFTGDPSSRLLQIHSGHAFHDLVQSTYAELTQKNEYAWIRTTGIFRLNHQLNPGEMYLVNEFYHHKKRYKFQAADLTEFAVDTTNNWIGFQVDYLTPEPRRTSDAYKLYFWYRGSDTVYIDNVIVKKFIPTK